MTSSMWAGGSRPVSCRCVNSPLSFTRLFTFRRGRAGGDVYDAVVLGHLVHVQLLQVCQGSLWEGGLRFEVELEAETEASKQLPYRAQAEGSSEGASAVAEEDAEGGAHDMEAARKERGWVPLVHAPANGEWPAVLIRQTLQPAIPPTPAVEWRVGERVEVSAVPCVQAWLPPRQLQCRLQLQSAST